MNGLGWSRDNDAVRTFWVTCTPQRRRRTHSRSKLRPDEGIGGVATEFGNEPQRRPDDRSDSTTTLGSGKRRTVGTQRAEVTCFGDVGLEGRCSARRILALLDRRKDGPAPEEEEEVTFLRTVSGRAPTHDFRFHDSRPR